MKISENVYNELKAEIDKFLSNYTKEQILNHRKNVKFVKDQYISFCWSIFHSVLSTNQELLGKLYSDNLDDKNIETALKKILKEYETI